MKTTFDLPAELVRALKLRAVREDRKLKDVAAEVVRRGLAAGTPQSVGATRRVRLPLVQCKTPAEPNTEPTPDQLAETLLREEAEWSHEAARR